MLPFSIKLMALIFELSMEETSDIDSIVVDSEYVSEDTIFYRINNILDIGFNKDLTLVDLSMKENPYHQDTYDKINSYPIKNKHDFLQKENNFNTFLNAYTKAIDFWIENMSIYSKIYHVDTTSVMTGIDDSTLKQKYDKNETMLKLIVDGQAIFGKASDIYRPMKYNHNVDPNLSFDALFYKRIINESSMDVQLSIIPTDKNINIVDDVISRARANIENLTLDDSYYILAYNAMLVGLLAYKYHGLLDSRVLDNTFTRHYCPRIKIGSDYNPVRDVERSYLDGVWALLNETGIAFTSVILGRLGRSIGYHNSYYSRYDLPEIEPDIIWKAMSDRNIIRFRDSIDFIVTAHAKYLVNSVKKLERGLLMLPESHELKGKKATRLTLEQWFDLEGMKNEIERRGI